MQAKRTPIGKIGGIFSDIKPHLLIAPVLRYLAIGLEQKIDDIILGNIVGPGGNIARVAALEADLPLSVTGVSLDRQCSAGLEAIRMACYFVQGGAGQCYIAGGVESTSTSPFLSRATFSPEKVGDPDMGMAAEFVAKNFSISRKEQDDYALLSYKRSWNSFESGFFEQEIIPFSDYQQDEELTKKREIQRLLKRSKPIFIKDGTVTAANSCGIHDGASAVLVMEENIALQNNLKPILRFIDSKVAGIHPNFPGAAPIEAIKKLLTCNKLSMKDIDLIEINEAFASKIVACAKGLSIPYEKLNVCGGALTLGHPYGASGSMMVTRLFYEAQRKTNVNYMVAAIGSGGGIGVAMLFEVIH